MGQNATTSQTLRGYTIESPSNWSFDNSRRTLKMMSDGTSITLELQGHPNNRQSPFLTIVSVPWNVNPNDFPKLMLDALTSREDIANINIERVYVRNRRMAIVSYLRLNHDEADSAAVISVLVANSNKGFIASCATKLTNIVDMPECTDVLRTFDVH